MTGALLVLITAAAQAPEEHAFVEVAAPRETFYVQERIRLRLRFGLEARFLRENLIPLFRQAIDVPVQVEARWLGSLQGTAPLAEGAAAPEDQARPRRTFSLNGGIAEAAQAAEVHVGDRTFTAFEFERSCLPLAPGELVIPEAVLTFAYATRFDEDLVHGRVPADRRDASVASRPLVLRILPLPEEGRPSGFTGAVGRFTIRAHAAPRELEAGASLRLSLVIEGEGNLATLEPPRLDDLEGFHVYGRIEEPGTGRRAVTYDLAALSEEVRAVPKIRFPFFDPGPPTAWRVAESQPIPLTVRPAPAAGPTGGGRGTPGVDEPYGLKSPAALGRGGPSHHPSGALILGVLGLPWIAALGLWAWLRARDRERGDPEGARARRAAAEFRQRISGAPMVPAGAMAEYLGARLRCPAAAVIAPDLAARLTRAGVPDALAARAAALLRELVAARYGGHAADDRLEAARALVDELEHAFLAREAPR